MTLSYARIFKLAPIALLVSALAVAGCANTVRGVGKDLNQTADAVEDSIN